MRDSNSKERFFFATGYNGDQIKTFLHKEYTRQARLTGEKVISVELDVKTMDACCSELLRLTDARIIELFEKSILISMG